MSITQELEKLSELYRSGAISSTEFEIAKRRVLDGTHFAIDENVLNDIKKQNEIAQLDRQWALEMEQFKVVGQHGHTYIPGQASSAVGGVLIVVFGCVWTLFASVIAMLAPFGLGLIFPVFGVVFVILGIVSSVSSFNKAAAYEEAKAAYESRRAELIANADKQF